ncbi:hypothetical protein M501DRAFT_1009698 [Patellaria atrata CBS 101060]|uniref:Life-span regulatory factor domain-containing protein n=1 Tax=Patellaria atrata CBS 101060 TaxID=1346257 RepID=A0A9P4S186_9PEZI|nr:hypothetical protein M501DRAFT_1009698 [Patellaria atrata CBS 101060]
MASTYYSRPSVHSKKPNNSNARPSKPAPLTKKGLLPTTPKGKPVQQEEEDEDSMAVSFLQYCAFCDHQIIVPNNSVLYCSESCRRKDNTKVSLTSLNSDYSPPATPYSNYSTFTFEDLPKRDIIPQRSPTSAHPFRTSMAFSESSEDENVYPGDDSASRRDSEAARYLRQFQYSQGLTEASMRSSRPKLQRATTSTPPLSHTPASTASISLPYTPATPYSRPLPPRKQGSSYGHRSVDLVVPFTSMSTTQLPSTHNSSVNLKSLATAKTSTGMGNDEMLAMQAPPNGAELSSSRFKFS